MKYITTIISENIWKYVWDNADNSQTDEDLCEEHTDLCNQYRQGTFTL